MSGWDDLVAAALLGADRRPPPEGLPPQVAALAAGAPDAGLAMLDLAAGYVGRLQAGPRPAHRPAPEAAPRQRLDLAPEPAQALLAALLRGGDDAAVEDWLRVCAGRGLGVRAGLWCPLAAAAAAARRGPDRALVCAALGDRGVAFAAAHPRWRVIAEGRGAATGGPRPGRRPGSPGRPRATAGPEPDQCAEAPDGLAETDPADPSLMPVLSGLPAPWPARAGDLALRTLAGGTLAPGDGRRLARLLAHRAPLSVRQRVAALAARERATGSPPGLVEADQVLAVRARIEHSFRTDTAQEHP